MWKFRAPTEDPTDIHIKKASDLIQQAAHLLNWGDSFTEVKHHTLTHLLLPLTKDKIMNCEVVLVSLEDSTTTDTTKVYIRDKDNPLHIWSELT